MEVSWYNMSQVLHWTLLLGGVYKSKHEALPSLWDDIKGCAIFSTTMSLQRFQNITRVIRFNNRSNRGERREQDKLPTIRYLWNKWETNLRRLLHPYENVTVYAQLVSFRGRCPFQQLYKPAKYRIKIWATCWKKTTYTWALQVKVVGLLIYNLGLYRETKKLSLRNKSGGKSCTWSHRRIDWA